MALQAGEKATQEAPQPAIVGSPTEFRILRLGTGEDFRSRLLEEFKASGAAGGSLVSVVGSFDEMVIGEGFYHPNGDLDMRQVTHNDGPYETGSMSGHLGYTEKGEATAHIHATFARSDGSLFGGHMFEGRILLTLEITIALHSSAGWSMRVHDPEPHVPMSIIRRAMLPQPAQSEKKA